jgi:hypothetical protein
MSEAVTATPAAAAKNGRRGMPVPKGGPLAARLAACVLEVLAGVRTPAEAAGELGVSLPRYYQLEQRALQGLVQGCEPAPRGRVASAASAAARLQRDNERLTRECQRQQALVRLARQAAGLANPVSKAGKGSVTGGKKRRPRRSARGQEAARRLRQQAEAATAEAVGVEPAAG